MMKKMTIVLIVMVSFLIVGVLIWQGGSLDSPEEVISEEEGQGFSVHDLNWDYYEEMNDRIVEASFTNPPYVYDDTIFSIGRLGGVLSLFGENLDAINDIQQGKRLSVKLRFEGITGEESFLGDVPPSVWQENNGGFILKFYFYRSLELDFFDALNEAAMAEFRSNEEEITLAEVDWDALRNDYESEIAAILIQGIAAEDSNFDFDMARFESGKDNLSIILEFLEVNQDDFHGIEDLEYTYQGTIHFWRDDDERSLMLTFFMDEALNRRLMDAIGEEAWERALR